MDGSTEGNQHWPQGAIVYNDISIGCRWCSLYCLCFVPLLETHAIDGSLSLSLRGEDDQTFPFGCRGMVTLLPVL